MTWTPPTQKWKSGRVYRADVCACVFRERIDALATPRIHTPVGFEMVCPEHADPDLEVGLIETFQGEWMTFEAWHAWESAWYSWVVWHEISERTDILDAERPMMQAKQAARSRGVSQGFPNLHRVETDDGPWKPQNAIRAPGPGQAAAVVRVYGWVERDDNLKERVKAEVGKEMFGAMAFWWEGQGGTRILHVDPEGALTLEERTQIDDVTALAFGPGVLVWED